MIGPVRRLAIAVVLACVDGGRRRRRARPGSIEQYVGRPVVDVRFEVEGEVQTSPVLAANVAGARPARRFAAKTFARASCG